MSQLAYCYASGEVGIGPTCPEGALPIGRIEPSQRDSFEAHCRHAYDGKTLLVPGVPEADNQTAGVDALHRFIERLRLLGVIRL